VRLPWSYSLFPSRHLPFNDSAALPHVPTESGFSSVILCSQGQVPFCLVFRLFPPLTPRSALFGCQFSRAVPYVRGAHSIGLLCCAVSLAVNSLCESPLPYGRSPTLVLTSLQRPYAHDRMSRRGFRLLQSRYATTKVLLSTTMRFFRLPLVPGIPLWNSLFFAFFSVHSSRRYPFRHSRYDGLEERRCDHRKQALVGKVRALSTLWNPSGCLTLLLV